MVDTLRALRLCEKQFSSKMPSVKILIASPNAILAKGVESILDHHRYLVALFDGSADDLLQKPRRLDADVLIVDSDSPEKFGASRVKKLVALYPKIKIIIINIDHNIPDRVKAIMQAGAEGCISKYAEASGIAEAVEAVLGGKNFLCLQCRQAIAESFVKANGDKQEKLTAQEKKIIELMAREYHNYEIADKLQISLRTVETHRKHIMKKIGAHNLAGVAVYAMRHGIITE